MAWAVCCIFIHGENTTSAALDLFFPLKFLREIALLRVRLSDIGTRLRSIGFYCVSLKYLVGRRSDWLSMVITLFGASSWWLGFLPILWQRVGSQLVQ